MKENRQIERHGEEGRRKHQQRHGNCIGYSLAKAIKLVCLKCSSIYRVRIVAEEARKVDWD